VSLVHKTEFTCAVLIAGIASCGGKVQTGDSSASGGPANAGGSVAESTDVSTGGQPTDMMPAGSGVGGAVSSGTSSDKPVTSTCMDRPTSIGWPATCSLTQNLVATQFSSRDESAPPQLFTQSCTCADCAPGVTAYYLACNTKSFWTFVACADDPQHCVTLRLSFKGQGPDPQGDIALDDSAFVDTNGFTWQLSSGFVHDNLGNFGADPFQLGHAISFDLRALAADPDGRSKSWFLTAHVSACVVGATGCAR